MNGGDRKMYHVKKLESKMFGPPMEEVIEDYLETERKHDYYFEFMAMAVNSPTNSPSYYIITKRIDPKPKEEA